MSDLIGGNLASLAAVDSGREWRLMSDYIDSGVDHGPYVDIEFTFPVEVCLVFLDLLSFSLPAQIEEEPYGELYFDYQVICEDSCYLEVWDTMTWLTTIWGGPGYNTCTSSPSRTFKPLHNVIQNVI